MIVSHRKQFIFIHIPKTAGNSVANVLLPYARLTDQIYFRYKLSMKLIAKTAKLLSIKNLTEKVTGFHKHAYASNVKDKLPPMIFERYFKFTFVRNPYDWLISLYYFILEHPEHYLHHIIKNKDFNFYINYQVYVNKLVTQTRYIKDMDGKILVDYIARYEDLKKELDYIASQVKIKTKTIPYINKTKGRKDDKMDLYTPDLFGIVNEHFRDDFDTLCYEYKFD